MAAPTNKEGEDLAVPLPKEWDLQHLKTGSVPIVYYGADISPPCCKIRFMLKYYGLPFTKSKHSKKPNSDYKKMPVLDMGDRQINDSAIIIKNLAPICAGRPLNEEELALEKLITYEVMLALEKCVASSCCNLCGCARMLPCPINVVFRCLSCCIACFKGPGMFKDKNLKSLPEYGKQLETMLGTKQFFGGDEPGIGDVSFFGMLVPFAAATNAADKLLGDKTSKLRAWHERMESKANGVNIFA